MRVAIKLVIGSIALMACTLGISVAFLATAGDDFTRRLLHHQMAEIIDREVRVDGTVSLDVSLEPTLSVTDVRIANPPWVPDRSFAHLERAEVQIVLLPLFSGIVHLRRLVFEGLTLRLETAADGRENWHLLAATAEDEGDEEPEEPGDAFYPLLEFISLDDIAVIYQDRQTGWSSELVLERLRKSGGGDDGSFTIEGSGRVNDSWFEIAGLFGSLEDALTAARPYPLELSFELPGLTAELAGTVADLPRAEGFALDLTVTSPSVGELLEVWEIERAIEGRATLSAHLAGDLEELAVAELTVDLEGRSGQQLHVEGSIEDVIGGHGLDLRFDGRLVPGVGLLGALPNALQDLNAIDLRGRVSGTLEQPAIEAFEAKLTHPSGIEATLAGDAAFNFIDDQPLASALALTADVSASDVTLLEELTGAELPAMGRLEASAEVTLDAGQVVLASLTVHLPDTGGLELRADGPLGKLSAKDFEVALDPRLTLSLSSETSQPLLALVNETFPDAGPLRASGELSRSDGIYRLENIRAALGSPGQLRVEIEGAIDPIGFAVGSEPRLTATVQFEWPSSQAITPYLGQEIVELGRASGSFAVAGTLETIALSEIAIETNSSDGLTVRASNGAARLKLADGAHVEDFAIDLSAESTTTKTVADLVGQDLPELGPLRASGRLTAMAGTFALAGLTGSLGPKDEPLLQVMGEVRNLADLTGLTLQGSYLVPTAVLLKDMGVTTEQSLGSVGGEFELTDADGSLGFETFTAELVESSLVNLSLTGLFDDIRDLDELDFQASLEIPDLEALGLAFNVPGLFPSPLAFEGRVKGSDEAFALTGETRIGETVIPGSVSGSFASPRPSFRAELSSPVFYFADFGLTPEVEATDNPDNPDDTDDTTIATQETPGSVGPHRLFDDSPLPFDVLRTFDLALDIRLDELDGVSLDVDSANLRASLADGLLTVEPLQFNFVGSSVTMRFSIDARSPDAKIRYFATIDDLDLGDLFGQLDTNIPIDGELDMIVNLQAEGDTPHALAESLHGEVDLAIERGHIRSRAFAFTALDLGSWLFARSTRRGYSELNCFVLRFDVVEGLADTETLFLDTANVQMFGDGNVNLGPETIHMEMDPRPKTRRIATLTTGFTIDGPLASPSVQVSVGGAALRTIGEIVLTPINLLGRLLPFVNDRGADEDNPCVTVQLAAPADATP
jgi:uncharacterized protein involved in outer membrane biogenesis